jgi:hypothetical protein
MSSDDQTRLEALWTQIVEKLSEQEWFQQLKAKWDELDPQSRFYLKVSGVGSGALVLLSLTLMSVFSVRSLRNELREKTELLGTIQQANEELRKLKDSLPAGGAPPAAAGGGIWSTYFEQTAAAAGIDKTALTMGPEKPGNPSELAKEALIDLTLKKINIKQAVRYAFNLEHGARPVKLRNLSIETKSDSPGYVDAVLAVSAFTPAKKD